MPQMLRTIVDVARAFYELERLIGDRKPTDKEAEDLIAWGGILADFVFGLSRYLEHGNAILAEDEFIKVKENA